MIWINVASISVNYVMQVRTLGMNYFELNQLDPLTYHVSFGYEIIRSLNHCVIINM